MSKMRSIRISKQILISELVDRTNISEFILNHLEEGWINMTKEYAAAISAVLHVAPEQLMEQN